MDESNFITEIFKDIKNLIAPLLALLNGLKIIMIKLFDFIASALRSFGG